VGAATGAGGSECRSDSTVATTAIKTKGAAIASTSADFAVISPPRRPAAAGTFPPASSASMAAEPIVVRSRSRALRIRFQTATDEQPRSSASSFRERRAR
jgi:hypothetical protein